MNENFQDIDGDELVPEHLKKMLISEIDVIRDTMAIVQMFLGEFMLAGVTLLQELEPKKTDN